MRYTFELNTLQRWTNPKTSLIPASLILVSMFVSVFHVGASLGFLLIALIFLYLIVRSNPKAGTKISVYLEDDMLVHEVGENIEKYRLSLINGVGKGFFGCSYVSLVSGHFLLIPQTSYCQIRDYLNSAENKTSK